jgi:hypothetical protein
MTLTRDDFDAVARSAGGAVHRVLGLRIARIATRVAEWTGHGTRSLLWKIPLRAVELDDTHEIIFGEAADEAIIAVEGTRWMPRSDQRAAVERPAPDAAAFIIVRTPVADKFEAGIPPMPFELRAREMAVLQHELREP